MADISLNAAGDDIDLTNASMTLTSGLNAHAQRVQMHFKTFLEESRYDRSAGVPWIQVIFAQRLPPDTTRLILDIYARSIPGVVSTDLNLEYDTEVRQLTVTGNITTIDGDVDFGILQLP